MLEFFFALKFDFQLHIKIKEKNYTLQTLVFS